MSSATMPGGWSETLPSDRAVQETANKVKPELEKQTNRKYPVYNAIVYRYQVVAGRNYLIKVSISNTSGECVHLLVWQKLPCYGNETILTNYQTGQTRGDPLEPFD